MREEPLCRRCLAEGRTSATEEVDHIIPKAEGGTDERENLQGLCEECHRRKTQEEIAARKKKHSPEVTLICGPPGAGKTTYAQRRMASGDLLVDLNEIYAAFSQSPPHIKPSSILPYALTAREAIFQRLEDEDASDVGHVYVTIQGARKTERDELAERLGARVHVLEVDEETCRERVRQRVDQEKWVRLISEWWRVYEEDEGCG